MMKTMIGAVLCVLCAAGCAGPLDRSWDNSTYWSQRDSQSEIGTQKSGGSDRTSVLAAVDIESLDSLTVEDAVRIAITNSPRLLGAGHRIDAARGRVTQAGLYPNPAFMFDAESVGSDAGSGGETTYMVQQEIVLGGKIGYARGIAKADQLAAQEVFGITEFSVASVVTRAYYAAVAAEERLRRRQELLDLAAQLYQAASDKVDAGAATEPDRLRSELELEQAQIELDAAKLEVDAGRRNLASVIGIDGKLEVPLGSTIDVHPLLPSRDEIVALVFKSNRRLKLARIAVERSQSKYRLARANAIPNLVASVGPRYSDLDDETTIDLGVGIEIPLFDRNQGEIKAAMADRLSNAAQLKNVELELMAEITYAWSGYETSRSAVVRYQENLLPKAERALALVRVAYQSGKAGYLRLLDAQQVLVESQIAYVDSLQRLHMSAALLNELAQDKAPWRETQVEDHVSEEVGQ